ncbi:MAG: TonB-dependent receptor [Pseudomonadota bacterium]
MNARRVSLFERYLIGVLLVSIACCAQAQEPASSASTQDAPAPAAAAPADTSYDDLLDAISDGTPTSTAEPQAEAAQVDTATPPDATVPPENSNASSAPELYDTIPLPVEKPQAPASEPARRNQIEEIIVTATKREESARDIPVTINALSGDDLEKMGARNLNDFITQVPGISLQDSSAGEAGGRSISVRGVGPGNASAGAGNSGNQTVGQFIGDIPLTDPYSNFITPDLDPYDLKNVEILKGPQGTTFGASALNGAIRYVPQEPKLDQWSARSFGEYLSVNEGDAKFSYGGVVNVPIGETLALRVVGVQQHAPGVYDNIQLNKPDADSRDKWSGRGQLRWMPLDKLSVNLLYQKQSTQQHAALSADNADGQLQNSKQAGPSNIKSGFDLASVDARYEFDDIGTLVFQNSYQHKHAILDVDAGSTGAQNTESLRAYANTKTRGYTYELRLVSPGDGDWNWIVGAFKMKYVADARAEAYIAGTSGLPTLPVLISPRGLVIATTSIQPQATETSLYGEVSRNLGERWQLTLGARRYQTAFSGERNITTVVVPNTAQINQSQSGFNPKVSLTYRPTDDVMTYATIARGFQFGGANAPPTLSLPANNPVTGRPVPVEFASSDLWSREIGIRTTWLEKTLQADVTVFDLDWSNAQFGQASGGAIPSLYIDNVGKVRSQGVEGSVVYLTPIENLQLSVAGSYTRARTATDYDPGDGNIVPAGTEMPATPKIQTSTMLAYSPMIGPWATYAALSHVYWSSAFNNINHGASIYNFQTYNFNMSLTRPDWLGAPSVALTVSNLTDKRAIMSYNDGGSLAGGPAWIYNRPRAISIRMSMDFQ